MAAKSFLVKNYFFHIILIGSLSTMLPLQNYKKQYQAQAIDSGILDVTQHTPSACGAQIETGGSG